MSFLKKYTLQSSVLHKENTILKKSYKNTFTFTNSV